MKPKFENRGGLIGQLRGLALERSDEGSWIEPIEQRQFISQSVSVRGEYNDIVRVSLEAKRLKQIVGRRTLQTFYTLSASHIQERVTYEFLPKMVTDALRHKKLVIEEGGGDRTVVLVRVEGYDTEEDEFLNYDDMDFRHMRTLTYKLNGNGTLLNSHREDLYEDDDEGGALIIGAHLDEPGRPKDAEAGMLSLKGWSRQADESIALGPNGELVKKSKGVHDIQQDVLLLDIIQNYVDDKKLLHASQIEQRQNMLTMLAFLNRDAGAQDIIPLV
jgi:hypothetical protein